MKPKSILFLVLIVAACQPKTPAPLNLGRIWKAQTVKEGTQLVYTEGSSNNVKPGYSTFRLDLSQTDKVSLKDIDGRTLVGVWSLSPDNKRLILEKLVPQPTATIGTIEFFILGDPTDANLQLQRTTESRKTGNSMNEYALVPTN